MWRPQQRLVRDLTQQRRQDLRLAPARDARSFPLDSPEISTILELDLSAYRRFARSEQPSIVGPKSGRAHPRARSISDRWVRLSSRSGERHTKRPLQQPERMTLS